MYSWLLYTECFTMMPIVLFQKTVFYHNWSNYSVYLGRECIFRQTMVNFWNMRSKQKHIWWYIWNRKTACTLERYEKFVIVIISMEMNLIFSNFDPFCPVTLNCLSLTKICKFDVGIVMSCHQRFYYHWKHNFIEILK